MAGNVEGPAIGIDLGTTYSCVAVWQHDRIEIITNDQGNRTTPSYVAFTDTQRLIGDAAKNQVAVNPTNTIFERSPAATMAIFSNLHKLTSRLNRTPSLSLYSKQLITRYSASSPSPSPETSSKKVADRIVKLFAIDFDGQKHEIVGLSGQTLLKALANNGLIDPASHRLEEIDACSAECEVNIAQEWLERLPPASYDEQYVLRRNSRARVLNKHSRLGCQVVLTQELQGMVVAVPEAKPWDIP
ncbi:hypothetical protein Vadar_027584 [Vaccinium darrowii]|uniref:Uncharacterized protein n=1 Tax=Vaccinium darrowii TaxID=229202 RepID=A0ACB7XD24_9ERIC|nr:hypothetical protein Vadar_027584 [Vaccinium darrowii]